MGSRDEAVKYYKKSKNKWKKELKAIKKQKTCSIELPIRPAHALKSRRSRLNLPRSATMISVILSATSRITIPASPVIATDMNIDGLLGADR